MTPAEFEWQCDRLEQDYKRRRIGKIAFTRQMKALGFSVEYAKEIMAEADAVKPPTCRQGEGMSDLIERLQRLPCDLGCEGRCRECPSQIGQEAATALSSLREERDTWERHAAECQATAVKLEAENASYCESLNQLEDLVGDVWSYLEDEEGHRNAKPALIGWIKGYWERRANRMNEQPSEPARR